MVTMNKKTKTYTVYECMVCGSPDVWVSGLIPLNQCSPDKIEEFSDPICKVCDDQDQSGETMAYVLTKREYRKWLKENKLSDEGLDV